MKITYFLAFGEQKSAKKSHSCLVAHTHLAKFGGSLLLRVRDYIP